MADRHVNILLSPFKLSLLASFKVKYFFIFAPKNEVSKANLNANKRILNCQPFLHRAYFNNTQCIFSYYPYHPKEGNWIFSGGEGSQKIFF